MSVTRPFQKTLTDEESLKKKGYIVGPVLGEGSYAKVKSAYSEQKKERVAIKIINRKKAPRDFQKKFLPRELEIVKDISHKNIIQVFDVMDLGDRVYITMEIAGHGDLLDYIKLRGAIKEETANQMFLELCDGIEYCHEKNIVHRDLKCENILLDVNNHIKITDFGFARRIHDGDMSKTFCGSAAYAAPEILQGIPYDATGYDIWSMGVILYIMVCGSMPYDDTNVKKMVKDQMEKGLGFSRSKKLSTECKDLIKHMLNVNPEERAKMSELRCNSWMSRMSAKVKEITDDNQD
ncbi:testis-specific serine/threonine-protein kinase 2-like [Saccoglossus kowalevskii]|uniref:Testis-specific serine/threonine-protein kinase 2-like n=1 Tax=Saccoglossus kowalevskii TaxID=10224 RepID=A0ABM0GWA5_SACKO|nr:PREDICTED: testis-specific serine/threonine-protein kinase 2-like [Saccoglossus kowalevskii]